MKKYLAVSNAGPLIHLSKVSLLFLLRKLYGKVAVPLEVKVEVVDKGKEKGFLDAYIVEEAIGNWIEIVRVEIPSRLAEISEGIGLKKAEAKVIYFAFKNNITALLDDLPARDLARRLGVKVRGSLGVIVESLKNGFISKKEALKAVDDLSDIMYLSVDVYRLVKREIENFRF
ncbi:MAG: hypothetical protein DRJ62_05280 [Thermoprotei archaeon]|nr:MAG: hypothetical protein DRJ62_05280 [Thermoprotei archaeon]